MAVIATVVGQVLKGEDGAVYLHEGDLDCRLGDKVEIGQVDVGRWVSSVKVIKHGISDPRPHGVGDYPLGF